MELIFKLWLTHDCQSIFCGKMDAPGNRITSDFISIRIILLGMDGDLGHFKTIGALRKYSFLKNAI